MSRGPLKYILKAVSLLSNQPDHIRNKTRAVLVSIGFSHYCEKSRWALMMSPLRNSFYEEVHCPAMHLTTTLLQLKAIPRYAPWLEEPQCKPQKSVELHKDTFYYDPNAVVSKEDVKIRKLKEITGVPKLVLYAEPGSNFNLTSKISFRVDKDESSMNNSSKVVISNGSSGINEYLHYCYPNNKDMASLYPHGTTGEQVRRLESFLDKELGPSVLAWLFGNLLLTGELYNTVENSDKGNGIEKKAKFSNKRLNESSLNYILGRISSSPDQAPADLLWKPAPTAEMLLFKFLGKPFFIPLMIKANGISAERREMSLMKIKEIFDHIDKLLAEFDGTVIKSERDDTEGCSRRYLFGNTHLSAADITLASMAAPLLYPPQTEANFGSLNEMTRQLGDANETNLNQNSSIGLKRIVDLARDLRQTRTGKYIMKLFELDHYNSSAKGSIKNQSKQQKY